MITTTYNLEPFVGSEVAQTVNGFEEIAVRKAFGASFETLEGTHAARALVFILLRRQKLKDHEAYSSAMELTIRELTPLILPEPSGVEDDPGKDS